MTQERRPSPHGTPAVHGRGVTHLDASRKLRELIKNHPEFSVTEYAFSDGEVLIHQGQISPERYAYLLIEGTVIEQRQEYSSLHGQRSFPLRELGPWNIVFAQALSAATVQAPSVTSFVAKTSGRAFQIGADWLTDYSRIDSMGVMIAALVRSELVLVTQLIEERKQREIVQTQDSIDRTINIIVNGLLQSSPGSKRTQTDIKELLAKKLQDGSQAEGRLADMESALRRERAQNVQLRKELEAEQRRAKEAMEGSLQAYAYVEAEIARHAQIAASTWKFFEAESIRNPSLTLSEEFMEALLGFKNLESPITETVWQTFEQSFNEAAGLPSQPPVSAIPEPELTGRPRSFDLPSFGDSEFEREITTPGVEGYGYMLPAKKPPRPQKGRTGFSGIMKAITQPASVIPPQPPIPVLNRQPATPVPPSGRKMTPQGIRPPTLAPPSAPIDPSLLQITTPPASQNRVAVDDMRTTGLWGTAAELGTADPED